jgi:hypothetical protein
MALPYPTLPFPHLTSAEKGKNYPPRQRPTGFRREGGFQV